MTVGIALSMALLGLTGCSGSSGSAGSAVVARTPSRSAAPSAAQASGAKASAAKASATNTSATSNVASADAGSGAGGSGTNAQVVLGATGALSIASTAVPGRCVQSGQSVKVVVAMPSATLQVSLTKSNGSAGAASLTSGSVTYRATWDEAVPEVRTHDTWILIRGLRMSGVGGDARLTADITC